MLMLPLCGGARRADAFGGFGRRLKRAAPLLAAPAALLLSQGQAKAVLTYNIFQSGSDVVIEANGSLNITGATDVDVDSCAGSFAFDATNGRLCTGTPLPAPIRLWEITGSTLNFGPGGSFVPTSSSGLPTYFSATTLGGGAPQFIGFLENGYNSGDQITNSRAVFSGKTLVDFGFTGSEGVLGTWTITGGSNDTIQVVVGSQVATVPGPIPLLGAGAAFGWSRRLRKRISASVIAPPQA